nr:oxidoreductase C-terminal domain-containing protein [Micromonospora sp. DSM 115978]
SEQFGRMIQYAGHRHGGETLVWRGSPSAGDVVPEGAKRPQGWSVGWFDRESRLVALATVGRPIDMVHGRKLMEAAVAPDLDRFADLSVPLKQLLP